MSVGSWTLAQELFTQGDARFVDEIRRIHDGERLADFAKTWFEDRRPAARAAMMDYVSRPWNAYRHDGLVKRLFKLAEAANDDALMGVFLVALDRSVGRQLKDRRIYRHQQFESKAEADRQAAEWMREGLQHVQSSAWSTQYYVTGFQSQDYVGSSSGAKMPRPPKNRLKRSETLSDRQRAKFERRFVLFSIKTRRYLRRRVWRYFRKLGKSDPARYLQAALAYLPRYVDDDTATPLALLDRWGLVHTLFGNCPAIVAERRGWIFAPDKSIADLVAAPRFELVWKDNPAAVFDLWFTARSRVVRNAARAMLRSDHSAWLEQLPVTMLLRLIDHPEPEVSGLGFDLLEKASHLESVPVEEWLARLNGDDFEKLQRLSDLLSRRFDSSQISLPDAIRLASHRSKPVADFGFAVLRRRTFGEGDLSALLVLTQAECEAVRPEMTAWLREAILVFGEVRVRWLLEFLDSKHADVRKAGWDWLNNSPLSADPTIWQHLIESPYDDVRGPLVERLQRHSSEADPESLSFLWAGVLLNVVRGGRYKPGVVAQVSQRLAKKPDEAARLLPLLAVAVRSLRGPEFRAGLAGVVSLAEKQPEMRSAIRAHFPELEF